MGRQSRKADALIAELARGSHGVVTRAELLAAVHHGVYRVGHQAPSVLARYTAAVKACGREALLSGRAAAHLWRLTRGSAPPPEVIVAADRRVRGVRVHRTASLDPRDAATHRAIPVTTVPRTLVDLASRLPEPALARACHEAGVIHRTTPRHVAAVLARRPNSPGRATLERILHGDVRVTLSGLEDRFLGHLREAGLPLPVTNRPAGGRRVDCRWPERRLIVELDSYRYHASRHAWERDRRREREARARGDEFRRYTHADVFTDPTSMLAELRDLLG